MSFSPKHNDVKMRAIYGALIVLSVAFMNIGTGLVRTIFMCITVVCLCTGLFLFTRFEMTTFSYIIRDNEGELDFYVDKATGKRGSYVCYYPLKDCVTVEKATKGIKNKIQENHGKTFFYSYHHNKFAKNKYIVVFQNDGYCDGIICELDEKSLELLNRGVALAKKQEEQRKAEATESN